MLLSDLCSEYVLMAGEQARVHHQIHVLQQRGHRVVQADRAEDKAGQARPHQGKNANEQCAKCFQRVD